MRLCRGIWGFRVQGLKFRVGLVGFSFLFEAPLYLQGSGRRLFLKHPVEVNLVFLNELSSVKFLCLYFAILP